MFALSYGGTYTVTGAPVVVDDLASEITGSIAGSVDRSAAGDGRDVADRVPQRAAAVAARDRARRRRHHVRRAVAGRRHADDGVDRGAADPDRAGGRLRDPVPVPRAGGSSRCRGRAGQRRDGRCPRGGHRRTDDRDRGARERGRVPGAAALAGADGPRVRAAAGGRDRDRAGLRADAWLRGDRALRSRGGASLRRRRVAPCEILRERRPRSPAVRSGGARALAGAGAAALPDVALAACAPWPRRRIPSECSRSVRRWRCSGGSRTRRPRSSPT